MCNRKKKTEYTHKQSSTIFSSMFSSMTSSLFYSILYYIILVHFLGTRFSPFNSYVTQYIEPNGKKSKIETNSSTLSSPLTQKPCSRCGTILLIFHSASFEFTFSFIFDSFFHWSFVFYHPRNWNSELILFFRVWK